MANSVNVTPILGGSPLGLITRSGPTRDGMSNFTGGASRNINVNDYNSGRKQASSNLDSAGNPVETNVSLFTGRSIPNFWQNVGKIGTNEDFTGLSGESGQINRSILHNDDLYDTSILNIVEKLSFSNKAALRAQDFAYLKNLGVLPNNRLMIARRFDKPMGDNIFNKTGTPPLAVLIGWKPQDEDFINIKFGEKWEDADADFTNVLNNLGKDFGIEGAGAGAAKVGNMIPMGGFTENIQRQILSKLGILSDVDEPLPSGNPNIIKMAKRRKTIPYGTRGSGLTCEISIDMVVEYEQKFISGIDPTVAWMDIVANATSFGTSNSTNYGLTTGFANQIDKYTGRNGITILIENLVKSIKEAFTSIKRNIEELVTGIIEGEDRQSLGDIVSSDGVGDLTTQLLDSIGKTIEKYKVEILGITHALSGLPSTPWHITIGNPLRPIFCSGDMYTQDVKLKMGPTLSFNDLPSTIKVEFTLSNARPLGLQEILAKFNTGHLRTSNTRRDYVAQIAGKNSLYYSRVEGLDNSVQEVQNNNNTTEVADSDGDGIPDTVDIDGDSTSGSSNGNVPYGPSPEQGTSTKEFNLGL